MLPKFHAFVCPMFNVGWGFCLLFGVMVVGFRHLYLLIIHLMIIATCMSRIPVRWLSDLGLSCWGLGSGFYFIILLILLPIIAKEKWTPSKSVRSYSPVPPQCRWTVPSVFLYQFPFLSQRQLMEKMCTQTANGKVTPLRKDTGIEVPKAKYCRTESLEQHHFWQ